MRQRSQAHRAQSQATPENAAISPRQSAAVATPEWTATLRSAVLRDLLGRVFFPPFRGSVETPGPLFLGAQYRVLRTLAFFLACLSCLALLACSGSDPPFEGLVVANKHIDVTPGERSGERLPLYIAPTQLGLCIEASGDADTRSWLLEPSVGDAAAKAGVSPTSRSARFACFEWSPPLNLESDATHELCATLVDTYEETRREISCLPFIYRAKDETHASLEAEVEELHSRASEATLSEQIAEFDELSARAADAGYLGLAIQIELSAVHFLTVAGEGKEEARRRLDALPGWLDEPVMSYFGGIAAYQRAAFELSEGRVSNAWTDLKRAEDLLARVAESTMPAVLGQADILAGMGALREASRRLRVELEAAEARIRELSEEQAAVSLDAWYADHARNQLLWQTLLDPEASPADLDLAKQFLTVILEQETEDPLERANRLINGAFLGIRRGVGPQSLLEEAEEILDAAEGTGRAAVLSGWVRLTEGLEHLRLAESQKALDRCRLLTSSDDGQLAAAASSCVGRAREQLGDSSGAAADYERAILLQQFTSDAVEERRGIGPGQSSVDYARLARLAIARGDGATAWAQMLRLDQGARVEAERQHCRQQAKPGSAAWERWNELDRESATLLGQLAEDERSIGQGRADHERIKERLRDLWREWPGCERGVVRSDDQVDLRAFWVDDEIFLLRREAGRTSVARRTAISARDLQDAERLMEKVLDPSVEISDSEWSATLETLAEALLPEDLKSLGPVTTYALHGRLQRVPVGALPVGGAGREWLAEYTTAAFWPSGAVAAGATNEMGPALFIVDPERNLRGSRELQTYYASLFPDATILAGEEASRKSFSSALGAAAFFHADAHAVHDPAFPELSSLRLADGSLSWIEIADQSVSLDFANLSACESGLWPTTADAGSFGLGGLLARLGARWVIASRGKLDNQVAVTFNRAFYRQIAAGESPPQAYSAALAELRKDQPASVWGGLMLLRSAGSS